MFTGGNWNDGSHAGSFLTNSTNRESPTNKLGAKPFLAPFDHKEPDVRLVDANALVSEMVDIMGGDFDDDTIHACIEIVKNSPTIKKKFGKWKKV